MRMLHMFPQMTTLLPQLRFLMGTCLETFLSMCFFSFFELEYRILGKKGEGTFSEVLKAQSTKTGKYVAIKCMKNRFESMDQVNRLREIQALRRLSPHPNIIKLYEVLYDRPTGRLALVFELMDMNIYELIRGRRHYLPEDKVKLYMYQLLKAMDHMHRNGIFHRDIKPENILVTGDSLKLADFGSCRGVYSKQPFTEYISTRWYRAPECLLTDGYYNYKMDMWGVGTVFFEILTLFPLFPGTNELDQIHKIHKILGTPPRHILDKMKKYVLIILHPSSFTLHHNLSSVNYNSDASFNDWIGLI
jgi:renal tumor antigen